MTAGLSAGLTAVVLVGGTGTRLRPLTLSVPKQVLPIVEVPMIHRVLAHLADHGVTHAVLSLGYLHQEFLGLFPDGRAGAMQVTYAVEPEPLDTAGAILYAATEAGIDARFVVANGDILTDLDVGAMVRFHDSRPDALATIALACVADPSAFGLVLTEPPHARVTAFLEKPAPGAAPAGRADGVNTINAGTYVFEPEALDRIAAGRRVSVEREVFPSLVAEGALYGFESDSYWTDTGTPRQYLNAQLDLLHGRRPGPPAPGAVRRDGNWWLDESPESEKVAVDITSVAPVLFGRDACVESGARVDGSIIGAGATVRRGATVTASVLLAGAIVGTNASVTRSLVGSGAEIGERSKVTNLSVIGAGAVVPADSRLDGCQYPDVS